MDFCKLCPRCCNVNRESSVGFCGETKILRIARAAPHFWEEPTISGSRGSGAVFFCGCSLKCCFCQNAVISTGKRGYAVTGEQLLHIFYNLVEQRVHNLNLITASHFTKELIPVLEKFKINCPDIPIVWNSSAYETVETLRMLEGLVDIYLPDFKFYKKETAQKYANAPDYPEIAAKAIAEMFRQRGEQQYDAEGMLKSGVQVRHLLLPRHGQEARQILWSLHQSYGNRIGMSLMRQYTPMPATAEDPDLSHPVSSREYDMIVRYAAQINIDNIFIQESDASDEAFIPEFYDEPFENK